MHKIRKINKKDGILSCKKFARKPLAAWVGFIFSNDIVCIISRALKKTMMMMRNKKVILSFLFSLLVFNLWLVLETIQIENISTIVSQNRENITIYRRVHPIFTEIINFYQEY